MGLTFYSSGFKERNGLKRQVGALRGIGVFLKKETKLFYSWRKINKESFTYNSNYRFTFLILVKVLFICLSLRTPSAWLFRH